MDCINLIKKHVLLIAFIMFIHSCKSKIDSKTIGVVSTATPEASNVGEQILLKGGNAIDAAVAISFALGVTELAMSGLGGGTQVLLSINNGRPFAINGTTLSPRNTPTTIKDTLTYHRRSTIPSTVKVMDYLWRNYGSGEISWGELIDPAIELAENGFAVGPFRAKVYKQYEDKLLKSDFNTAFFLIDGERIPKEGEIIKQPILANTLRHLAKFGAADFYNGEIAKAITIDMNKHGGWITLEDLNTFPEPIEMTPLTTNYKGMTVYSQPPPCGGWTVLLALNLIAQNSKENNITNQDIIEALYLAHNDRENHPITDLVNYDSISNVKLSVDYASSLRHKSPILINRKEIQESGETTHFSVVDSNGNAIAVTASINAYFGALAASSELGFLYNTYMDDFIFESPEHSFAIRPKAMAYSSMSPTIVQNEGENVLVIGSPGSERIISSVAQITAKWIQDKTIEHLVEQHRVHVSKNNIYFENPSDSISINQYFLDKYDLQFKKVNESYTIKEGLNAYFGGIHAIAKENNIWIGVSDPRRDGKSIIVTNN